MNAAHQSAVAHLKERMSAHPLAVLVAVEIEHLKQLDSLITELEADGKRLDWLDAGNITHRQAIDAAMKKGVV